MAEGGSGPPIPKNVFEARLDTTDGVSSTLTLGRYQGDRIEVSGVLVRVPAAGFTRGIADNLTDGNGADSGAAPVANTRYYVYVSNGRATFSPKSIRLSATPPVFVDGVKYLNTVGNGLNWRFVGFVAPNATPQFESSLTSRTIVNYYNRFRLPMMANPGYVNDNAYTFYTLTSTVYVELNAGVGARVQFISNGEDEVHLEATFVTQMPTAGFSGQFGIGIDTVAGPENVTWTGGTGYSSLNATEHSVYDNVLSEAVHFAALLGLSNSGATINVYADFQRDGAAVDPRATMIRGFIQG